MLCMIFIKKVISIFVVDLNKWDIELILILAGFGFELLENIAEHPGYYASFLPFLSSTHSIGLTAASLPVSKDSPIIPINTIIDDRLSNSLKYFFLWYSLIKNLFETELMMISCIRHLITRYIDVYYLLVLYLERNSNVSYVYYFCLESLFGFILANT